VVVGIDQPVEDPEPFDDLAVRVRQQRKRDRVRSGVVRDCVDLVVAEGIEGDAGVGEVVCVLLQLDQLRAARRSPHGGAVEHEHRCPIAPVCVDVDDLAGVRDGDHVGKSIADVWSGRELTDRILARPRPGLGGAESAQLVFPEAGFVPSSERMVFRVHDEGLLI
jgi:hypothetical protein